MNHIYQEPQFGEDWFSFAKLYKSFVEILPDNSIIVEVGCWKGKSTSFLAVEIINSGKKIELHAVDTWQGSYEHRNDSYIKTSTLYDLFLSNIEPVKSVIKPIKKPSVEAAKIYEDDSLDVVFIDACHEYQCVRDDIAAWYPKIKRGGVMAGHDYYTDGGWAGVYAAVTQAFPPQTILHISEEACWLVKKP